MSAETTVPGPAMTPGKGSYERMAAEKAKLCLDALAVSMQASLELRKKSMRESFVREQVEEQLRTLQQRAQAQQKESAPELSRVLELANVVVKSRQESELRRELAETVENLKLEVECAREETERVRERYREALVSSTRSSLQTSQLSEELEAARQQSAKAERNAVREARKATLATEEKVNLTKRCEQLEKQVSQLRNQLATNADRTAIRPPVSSGAGGFRVKPVDDVSKGSMRAAGTAGKNRTSVAGTSANKRTKASQRQQSLEEAFEDDGRHVNQFSQGDPNQAEFDFI